jgi:hypothetical protein
MSTLSRRLAALEQRKQAVQGLRIFQQSEDTPEVFYEVSGAFYKGPQGYTRADIAALRALGWQTILVVYGPWPPFATEE